VLGGFSSVPVKKVNHSQYIPSISLLTRFFPGLQENEKAKDKGLVTLNQDAVVSEIERLGRGIVKKITISEQS
jgi:hypothetical protein